MLKILPLKAGTLTPELSTARFTLLLSIGLVAFYNGSLWSAVLGLPYGRSLWDVLFLASLLLFLVLLLNLLLSLIAFKHVLKPVSILILMTTAVAAYFMDSYGVMLDHTMIRNVMETDTAEVFDLINGSLLLHVALLGVLPALFVYRARIRYRSWTGELKLKAGGILLSLAVIALIVLTFYQDYASLLRNNRHLRHLFTPVNYIYATGKYVRSTIGSGQRVIQPVGEDAVRGGLWAGKEKKTLLVLVVGETARARNFSLNGYPRLTNPHLGREAVINFTNIHSCGTSTAVSIPCMFSNLGRAGYDDAKAKGREGLLDVLSHAGLRVLWRDNNSGCKGVCDRIETQPRAHFQTPDQCEAGRCFDEVLLNRLDEYLAAADDDTVIVLHQNGSHGPAYYRRYPRHFEHFTPVCATNQLQNCTQQEIVNTYDNTILYTDYFLSRVIQFLKDYSDRYDSAMVYVSDHGESLGEGNLYLHGLPYFMAPDEQKHVPFIVWLSEEFQRHFAIDTACLAHRTGDRFSHDNLFHSVLGLLNVETRAYDGNLDIFAGCRQQPGVNL